MTYSSLSKRFPNHSYFCGWYFRCQSDKQTLAIIPSVHKTKDSVFCTIQVITDIKNQLLILEQISSLVQRGFTVITTTHNPGQTLELGGTALLLTGDRQIYGPADIVLSEDNLREVYDLNIVIEDGHFRKYATFRNAADSHHLVY